MAACCKGGATVGGGTDAQIALLEQYGLNLGIAFQIIDDVLDYSRRRGVDWQACGQRPAPGAGDAAAHLRACKASRTGMSRTSSRCCAPRRPPDAAVRDVVAWVAAGPAIEEAFMLARQYSARARALLAEFPASPERDVLETLVDFVVDRSR